MPSRAALIACLSRFRRGIVAALLSIVFLPLGASADDSDQPSSPPPGLADQPSQVNGNEINPAQENAVKLGLSFLSHRQTADGSFGSGGGYGATAAITSLSGLAFMANGNLPGRGIYGDNVRKAVDFICRNQQESGLFTTSNTQGEMYSHGFSTLFIGEVYGMTGDWAVKENLQKAVRLIHRIPNSESGLP